MISHKRNAKSKCALALFVCMSTKAIHLELVTDLSTPSHIATLDRFIARRGLPFHTHSDCGTNFFGAFKKLKELIQFKGQSEPISNHLSRTAIRWTFTPTASPHFGGILGGSY
ncbi:unnamed protein product [Nezara viridula]|uniref:Integrase catalytic domain-containing protein n=1 Tax=Nezara viridula TaxID=85310 RepID=A0A9P0EDG7_NEZVI|nr:unnamed protein product [Nezara viridula]